MTACMVPGCPATTDSSYAGQPECLKPFAGDIEAHRRHLSKCMLHGVSHRASGCQPESGDRAGERPALTSDIESRLRNMAAAHAKLGNNAACRELMIEAADKLSRAKEALRSYADQAGKLAAEGEITSQIFPWAVRARAMLRRAAAVLAELEK